MQPKAYLFCSIMSTRNLGKRSFSSGSSSHVKKSPEEVEAMVHRVLERAGLLLPQQVDERQQATTTTTTTITKAGWCLRQGLTHLATQDERLARRIDRHGVPTFYDCYSKKQAVSQQQEQQQQPQGTSSSCLHEATQDLKDPATSFESLCRIIAGQFVSGKSARAAWRRLLTLRNTGDQATKADEFLTPALILARTGQDGAHLDEFQTSLGLTKNKAKSLYDLALHFTDGRLSEEFLQQQQQQQQPVASVPTGENKQQDLDLIRKSLLAVRGIGEWSCDMFLLFTLEHADVLPLGDLGVRKGIAKHFFDNKPVCQKKDAQKIQARLEPFRPYRSLLSYYMWSVADTPDEEDTAKEASNVATGKFVGQNVNDDFPTKVVSKEAVPDTSSEPSTPPKKRPKRSAAIKRVVTP